MDYGDKPSVSFAVLPKECFGICTQCKTFPYCVLLRNSQRYKTCPCNDCVVKILCVTQCDKFKNEISSLFNLKDPQDYKNYWYSLLE